MRRLAPLQVSVTVTMYRPFLGSYWMFFFIIRTSESDSIDAPEDHIIQSTGPEHLLNGQHLALLAQGQD